jgi:putrescine transport system ATP-binding protein
MSMADRIGVMDRGRLVQVGSPSQIYEQPSSRWVADFVGSVNLIEGELSVSGPQASTVECTAGGRLRVAQAVDAPAGTVLWVAVRPEKIQVAAEQPAADENRFAGKVVDIGYLGDISIYKVKLDNGLVIKASATNRSRATERAFGRGDRVFVSWPASAAVVLTQ